MNMIASTDKLGPNRRIPGTRAVRWFRAYRRTRPFWGGLWLALGGVVVVYFNRSPLGLALTGGFNHSAGYILGGAMVLFAGVALASPLYARLVGVLGILSAMAAFIGSNFGGFLVGSVLGILGGAMIWGWGELAPRRPAGARVAPAGSEA
jgi:hypothetical protein